MNRKFTFLAVSGMIILMIIIAGLNILIKKYERDSFISQDSPVQADEQSAAITNSPPQEIKTLESEEEMQERESVVQTKGPLLN